MIQLLFGLLIFFLIPIWIKNRTNENPVPIIGIYIMQAFVWIAVWTVISIPFVYLDLKFNIAVWTYIVILTLVYFLVIFHFVRKNNDKKSGWIDNISIIKDNKTFFVLMCILIAYQLFRCSFYQVIAYSDNKTYISLINDIVETNKFFLINDLDGSLITSMETVSRKYILCSWYTFEAVISYLTGMHPLVIVNTVMPPIVLLFSYMAYWLLSEVIFEKQYNKRFVFLLMVGLIYQFLDNDPALYFITWPTWGKSIIMSIMIPIVIYWFYDHYIDYKLRNALLMLTCFVACFTSTMGVVIMPVLYSALMLNECFRKRCICVKDGMSMAFFFCPLVVYASIYILW